MAPDDQHPVGSPVAVQAPGEESAQRARIAGISLGQPFDHDAVGVAGRIGLAHLVADRAGMLALGVNLDADMEVSVRALLAHLGDVFDAVVAEIIVAADIDEHRPWLSRQRRRVPVDARRPRRADMTDGLWCSHSLPPWTSCDEIA